MSDSNEDIGIITRDNGYLQGCLTRILEHEPEAVWEMLTDPARIPEWLAPGEIALRQGGQAKLNFTDSGIVIDSTVSAYDPPHLLEYSWSGPGEPERPIRWQTRAVEGGTELTLTVRVPEDEDISKSCAGWEAHLMMLLAAIEGVPIKFPFERYLETREKYGAMLA